MAKRSRFSTALVLGLAFGPVGHAPGQPAAPATSTVPGDLKLLAQRLANQLTRLSNVIVTELGPPPSDGPVLAQDAQELSRAVDDFRAALPDRPDRFRTRRAFAGIDISWYDLAAQLARPDVATPNLNHEVEGLAPTFERIHQALDLNPYPASYFGSSTAPEGVSEARRLAQALVDRAEALAAAVRTELTGNDGVEAMRSADSLVRTADAFHDGIDLTARTDLARNGFAGVAVSSKEMRQTLASMAITPRVRQAWRAYVFVEVLLRQALGLSNDPDDLGGTAIPARGPSPVVALAGQLAGEVGALVKAVPQGADASPDGKDFAADARRLQQAAEVFRNAAATGRGAGRLAFEFRAVDASWQRLARRANRVARAGGTLNVERIEKIGQLAAELHELLGLPGYPPVVGPFPAPG